MVSSAISTSYSSTGGDNESTFRPSSHRSLDFGLNRSLRYLDTRYVEESDQESENSFRKEEDSNGLDLHQQGQNHRNPTNGRGSNGDSNNSGYLSRTNDILDDGSYWSAAASTQSQEENGSRDAASTSENRANEHSKTNKHNSSDDPSSTFFRLLDRHCSVSPSENEDYDCGEYEYSNHSKAVCNDWEPIRGWLEAMTTPFGKPLSSGESNEESNALVDDLEEHDPHKKARESLLRAAVLDARGKSGETVLHVACERSVPMDVLELLLSIEVLEDEEEEQQTDTVLVTSGSSLALCSTIDGWLPLHYACNYPNEYSVVERLVEAFPDAKTHADLKGRTPLHFAMREENMNRPEVVALLACAAGIADDNGILVRPV